MMRVLVGYECSGVVAAAFRRRGHEAWSCDILPYRGNDAGHIWHLHGDVFRVLAGNIPRDMTYESAWRNTPIFRAWDLVILHPDCTYLTVSAAWAFKDGPYHQRVKPGTLVGAARRLARDEALTNFRRLLAIPSRLAIENPSPSFINTAIRKPDQVIQPYMFGEDASKATGLWLKGLPPLVSTKAVAPRMVDGLPRWGNQTDSGQNRLSPSDDRAHLRAVTYPGIAEAMAEQWGNL